MIRWSKAVSGESCSLGQLDQIDLPSINQRLQRQYQDVGFMLIVAATDVSLIEDSSRRGRPVWQAGVFGIALGLPVGRLPKQAVKRLDPGQKPMPFSVYLPEPLRVAFKPELRREFGKGHREHRLQALHMRELARFLARYDMPDRYVLSGCRLRDDRIQLNLGVQELLKESALLWSDTLARA
jgi:hypothetical protein